MSYYEDIYLKRTNRFGGSIQERLEGARRHNFEAFLKQSPHYTTFEYDDKTVECVFEPLRQNETKTLMHVLVRADQVLRIGNIVTIADRDCLIYYHDERRDSGYNRYTVLLLSHDVTWLRDGVENNSKAYVYFQEDNMLKRELKSRSRMDTLYLEDLKLNFIVMPTTDQIQINDYLTVSTSGINQHFRVTGFDIVSTPGVMYVSMAFTPERELSTYEPVEEDDDDLLFWLGLEKPNE